MTTDELGGIKTRLTALLNALGSGTASSQQLQLMVPDLTALVAEVERCHQFIAVCREVPAAQSPKLLVSEALERLDRERGVVTGSQQTAQKTGVRTHYACGSGQIDEGR